MTRAEAHRKVERPTWGDRTKAVAKIAEHIITTHKERNA